MNKRDKEYFNNIPKEYTNLGKKIYMYYGKEYPRSILNRGDLSPFNPEIYQIFDKNEDQWRTYWWGGYSYKMENSICKPIDGEFATFTKQFLEWMGNNGG